MKANRRKNEWMIPTGLVVLSVVPVVAGMVRLVQLGSGAINGAVITPENVRFFDSPLPVVLHIISVSVYAVLGAFQFAPGFRRRHRRWHQVAGRVLLPCGFVAALSGLWMSHFYILPELDGEILYMLRLIFGSAMFLALALGARALWRRNFKQHGAWMLRAYAIGMGAGTQVFTHVFWELFIGAPDEFSRAFLMGAGWVINVIVAEWIIRRRPADQSGFSNLTGLGSPANSRNF